MNMIQHNQPFISKNAIKTISHTINSGWINYNKVSNKAENKLSNILYSKPNRATLTVNGTSAIYIALKALNIKKGDEIIIPDYTCTALANAINLANAKVIICDISKKNLSLTKKLLKPLVTKRTKAIIAVHTFGIPCEIDKIKELNIPIIEDCSQSLGSKFKDNTPTGSKGDIAVFSFYASKLITGGIGGAIASNNKNINKWIKDYINFDTPKTYKKRFNFQISDINSSLILLGLNELNKVLDKKNNIARKYLKIIKSEYNSIEGVNNYRFLLKFKTSKSLKECRSFLFNRGIKTILPIENFELLSEYLNLDKKDFKNSQYISKRLLSVPIHSQLTGKDINTIQGALNDYFSTSTSI